jgi:hypothetical protein
VPGKDSKPVLLASILTARLRRRDTALINASMTGNPAGILVAPRFAGLAGGLPFARLACVLLALSVTGLAGLARSLALTCLTGGLALTRLASLACVLLAGRMTGYAGLVVRAGMARHARVATAGDTGLAGLRRTLAIGHYGFGLLFFPVIPGSIDSLSGHARCTPTGCSQADVEIELIIDFLRS